MTHLQCLECKHEINWHFYLKGFFSATARISQASLAEIEVLIYLNVFQSTLLKIASKAREFLIKPSFSGSGLTTLSLLVT